jgi:hypothetical protein
MPLLILAAHSQLDSEGLFLSLDHTVWCRRAHHGGADRRRTPSESEEQILSSELLLHIVMVKENDIRSIPLIPY